MKKGSSDSFDMCVHAHMNRHVCTLAYVCMCMCAYVYTHTAKNVNISYFQTAELGCLFTLYSPSLLFSSFLLSPLLSSPLLILFL